MIHSHCYSTFTCSVQVVLIVSPSLLTSVLLFADICEVDDSPSELAISTRTSQVDTVYF